MRLKSFFSFKFFSVLLLALSALIYSNVASAQMSDEAVVAYVKESVKSGKSQQEIASSLLAKGVTKEQLKRLKAKYEESQKSGTNDVQPVKDVRRTVIEDSKVYEDVLDQRLDSTDLGYEMIDKDVIDKNVKDKDVIGNEVIDNEVYGRRIFKSPNVTFEPSLNLATPIDYRLGPGDQVIINVYGASESNITQNITPEGYINIPSVGPVNLNGLTLKAAKEKIYAKLSKIYSGMQKSDVDMTTDVQVTIGEIRTIQVNILGEVSKPGTYALSSFSTVFHALYKAKGVNKIGSLRDIKVMRGDKVAAVVDIYEYLIKGKSSEDIRLQEGDMIVVPPYKVVAKITGNVKRPMCYELKEGETLQSLINYAGGFKGDAYFGDLTVDRSSGMDKMVYTVDQKDFATFKMEDADKVNVGSNVQLYRNRVEIKGAVYRPGPFELSEGIASVKDLIQKAGGVLDDAFLNRGVLHRRYPDKRLEVLSVNVGGILNGTAPDIKLMNNDILYIPSIYDLKEEATITVEGDVYAPGSFPYAENTTLEDIIVQAGGLKVSASTVRVDVSRALKDSKAQKKQVEIAETFTFALKDGFVIDGTPGFILEPYDQVFVRTSPGYTTPMNVVVTGEVQFAGTYTLTKRNERLSDIIAKAGGVSDFAYMQGATLTRRMTRDEREMEREIIDMLEHQNAVNKDTILLKTQEVKDYFTIAIDLDKAIANPHSDFDITLREGDVINVPQYSNVVRISGNVNNPNVVTYNPDKGLAYYIDEAGGLAEHTKRSNIFIIYPNGHIARVGGSAPASMIKPGSEIIVPRKGESKWNTSTMLSALSTTASIMLVIATLINNLK